jgi:hypothetical protein
VNIDPLDVARRQIAETQWLLALLITSSESFDYPKAKEALAKLQLKIGDLDRLQAEFERLKKIRQPNICVVDFSGEDSECRESQTE